MAKIRVGRVAEQIKKELSLLLQNELKDPRIGFTTVTGVQLTNDLSQATIFVSVLGEDEQKEASLKALQQANGYIRSEIGQKIRLRHTPELIFKIDQSVEYGNRIESILKTLNDKDESE